MAVVTNHQNSEVDIAVPLQDIGTLENSPTQQKLTDLINGLGSCGDSSEFIELLDYEYDHDGRISKLMIVYYKHLDSLLSENKIDKKVYGEAAIDLLKFSTDVATRSYEFDKNYCLESSRIISDLAKAKVDLTINELKKFTTAYEVQDLEYKIKVFNPLTRESMKEDVHQRHVNHELSKFDLDNMKPQELLVLKEEVLSSIADRKAKEYYQANVQPKELEKLDAETDTLRYIVDNMKPQELLVLKEQVLSSIADRKAKEYYQENVQPIELEKLDAETDTLRYIVDNMKPQELLVLKEQVLASIADREAKEYYKEYVQPKELEKLDAETDTIRYIVDNMKPQELLVLKEQVLASIADRQAKEFYRTDVQPKELEKLDAETDTLRYIIDNMKPQELLVLKEQVKMSIADRQAKEYYHTDIQPCEKILTCAKAEIERINAGQDGSPSLPSIKHAQIVKQTELYAAEIASYDDRRRQELLKTIMNYHSMIFPDLPEPDAIEWASDVESGRTLYTALSG